MMNRRLAAIDIGTNSFHLVVAEIIDNQNYKILESKKEVIRLRERSDKNNKIIQEGSIQRAIGTLKEFLEVANNYNAKIKTVATSAVREASNKSDFLKRVNIETGINIEIITGVEEGRLIYLGVLQSLPVFDKNVLCIDIGGGSTEFVIGSKGKILYSKSMKLGAVRLTNMFFKDGKVNLLSIKECEKWVERVIFPIKEIIGSYKIDVIVGTSGTIMTTGLMTKAMIEKTTSLEILNNYKISASNVQKIKENILSKNTTNERKNIIGLDEKRADIIPAGIILLSTIFNQLKIDEMTISGYALREGVIFDTMNKEFL